MRGWLRAVGSSLVYIGITAAALAVIIVPLGFLTEVHIIYGLVYLLVMIGVVAGTLVWLSDR